MRVSIDDACALDTRVVGMCLKYGHEVILYVPVEWHGLARAKGYEPIDYFKLRELAKHVEIGSHAITHTYLTNLDKNEAKFEIYASKYILQDMFDTLVTKFCPPRGYTNTELSEWTLTHYDSQRLTKGKNLVHVHPNSGVNDNKHWLDCLTDETEEIWGHSWEIQKYNEWSNLEKVLSDAS